MKVKKMIKYIRLCFLILGSLVTTSNLCIITTIRIYSNGPKKVCLIGEVHNEYYRSDSCCQHTEDRDKAYMLDLAQSSANGKKHVTLCIEETAYKFDCVNKVLSRHPDWVAGTMTILSNFSQTHNGTVGNATFLFADNRGPAVDVLASFMYRWGCSIVFAMPCHWNDAIQRLPQNSKSEYTDQRLTCQFVDEKLSKNPLLRENLFSPSSLFTEYFSEINERTIYGRVYTVGELFQELNNFLNELSTKLNTLDKDSALYHYINEYKESFGRTIADARKFFMESTGNDPKTFEKRIAQCAYDVIVNKLFPFSYLAAEYKKWGTQLMRIADMGFAFAIDEALLHSDVVILYVGSGHCERLEPFMKLKQFAKIYEKKIKAMGEAEGFESLCPDERMKEYFVEIKRELDL